MNTYRPLILAGAISLCFSAICAEAAPENDEPLFYFASASKIVAEYPYKIAVFERPSGVTIAKGARPQKLQPGQRAQRRGPVRLMKDGNEFPISNLKLSKEISFKELIFPLYYPTSENAGDHLLVCSNLLADPNNHCS